MRGRAPPAAGNNGRSGVEWTTRQAAPVRPVWGRSPGSGRIFTTVSITGATRSVAGISRHAVACPRPAIRGRPSAGGQRTSVARPMRPSRAECPGSDAKALCRTDGRITARKRGVRRPGVIGTAVTLIKTAGQLRSSSKGVMLYRYEADLMGKAPALHRCRGRRRSSPV